MKQKIILILILCMVVAITATRLMRTPRENFSRLPSSTRWLGKHQRLLDIKIQPVGDVPTSEDKDLVLKGMIQGTEPINGEVYYTWILPPGASLVDGELSDSVSNMPDPSKFLERAITVQGVHRGGEPQVVILQAYTVIDGVRIGNAAVFSTDPNAIQFSGEIEKLQKADGHPLPSHVQQ